MKEKATDKQVKYIFWGLIVIFFGLIVNAVIGSFKPLNYKAGLYFGLFIGISLTLGIASKVEIDFRKEKKREVKD